MRPLRGSPDDLGRWAETVIAAWPDDSTPVINVMFHSVEAVPDASPYAATEREVAAVFEGLSSLFGFLRKRYRVSPKTLCEFGGGFER